MKKHLPNILFLVAVLALVVGYCLKQEPFWYKPLSSLVFAYALFMGLLSFYSAFLFEPMLKAKTAQSISTRQQLANYKPEPRPIWSRTLEVAPLFLLVAMGNWAIAIPYAVYRLFESWVRFSIKRAAEAEREKGLNAE